MKSRFMNVASVALVSMVSAAACGASLTLGEPNLVGDQLTVPVTVSGSSGGTLELYIGEAGPKDGEPSATTLATSVPVSADGNYDLVAQISVGAKIAYKAVLGSDQSSSGTITATDDSEYIWVNNATGIWSDPNNWTRKKTSEGTDTYKNIGYPAYTTGQIRFNGNQTAEVTLDADYGRFGDLRIDNPGLNLTIHGGGYELKTGNTHTTGNNTFVFDNVRFDTSGSYSVGAQSSMRMTNGSYFKAKWEFNVNGANAYLYVGPNCEVFAGNNEWWTFRLDGEGATVELDDGYIHARGFRVGQNNSGATPTGFIVKGSNPRLVFDWEFVVCNMIPSSPVFTFVVPLGGYTSAPITKRLDGNYQFGGSFWTDHTPEKGYSETDYPPIAFNLKSAASATMRAA